MCHYSISVKPSQHAAFELLFRIRLKELFLVFSAR